MATEDKSQDLVNNSTLGDTFELGDKIKALEEKYAGKNLNPNLPFVVRLDGHGFSKFTRGFAKPMDERLKWAMILTTQDLVNEFNARTGFVESDEITLVFPPIPNEKSTLIYSGRKLKICSLMAGYASARFNFNLRCEFERTKETSEKLLSKVGKAYFDARVFSVDDEKVAMEAIWWRYRFDTWRNGVAGLAQAEFSTKELHGKSTGDQMKMLKEKGIMLVSQDPHLLFGTFVKKEMYDTTGYDPKKKVEVPVKRSRLIAKSLPNWKDETEEKRVLFVMRKYWNE